MSAAATAERRKPSPLPAPPPPGAKHATLDEAAGYIRIRRSALDEIRRSDPTFPMPILVTGGLPRLVIAELDVWLSARPRGWSAMGGRREAEEPQRKRR